MNGLTERNGWYRPKDRLPPPQHVVQVVYDDYVTNARMLAFRELDEWVNWETGGTINEHAIVAWAERGDV